MPEPISGSCLCGTVKFTLTGPFSAFRYCHCSRCRKASGSAHAANLLVPRNQFKWTAGESSVKRYKLPSAQRFAVWFCTECGTRVPHEIPTRDDVLAQAVADVAGRDVLEQPATPFLAMHAAMTLLALDDVAGLDALAARHERIGEVRTIGCFQAMEFVSDPETRERDTDLQDAVAAEAMRNGVIADSSTTSLNLQPSLLMPPEALDVALGIVADATDAVLAG